MKPNVKLKTKLTIKTPFILNSNWKKMEEDDCFYIFYHTFLDTKISPKISSLS